ncbi:GNAT family N-acetyltransferase [Flavobacterium cyanobacteriorum]|uniref:GNAT family N-acetyltransferase n=1 Tax=Flavobacterium cyanobacteriorum TaxID=2022802 RepID=A0A255ZTD3_9FLAO|nr:GNAT family protein [Flavobacterium cyanobacteriorum]OYQ44827.1 GNAT family N-acetyltransferase [Flavobacterium cyanobacteriorum]
MDISIRKWDKSDIDNLKLYANNKNISDKLADAFPFPYTEDFGLKFIDRVSNESPTKIFAITIEDKAIGSIGIFPCSDIHRKNADIAYWIAEPYWGRGVAVKAIALIIDYAFKTFGITRIYAKPYGSNPNSHRVLEKAGFELEATLKNAVFKNNEYLDELIYVYTNDKTTNR